ncbi:MAG: DUF1080 domain-containing protein [Acidimicrobiia bacterium]|nr:DUF1080 domain-containing protein [Acidimicrobiia bacterium]
MKSSRTRGLVVVFLLSVVAVHAEQQWTRLSMFGDAIGQWRFVGGDWKQNAEGVINSPGKFEQHHLAFLPETAYANVEAEFEFRRDSNHGGVGLVVRAQDAQRYYVVEFPFCGQQAREGHFWSAITRVDASGWGKVLLEERVAGVPAEAGLWQQARVALQGTEFRVWVNGRPLTVVSDATYPKTGRLGLVNWGPTSIRNLRVRGTKAKAAAWDERRQPIRPWYNPYPTADRKQGTPGLTRAPNGDLLMPDAIYVFDVNSRRLEVFAEDWQGGALRGAYHLAFAGPQRDILLASSVDRPRVHRFDHPGARGMRLNNPKI